MEQIVVLGTPASSLDGVLFNCNGVAVRIGGLFEGKGLSTSRVSPPGPLSSRASAAEDGAQGAEGAAVAEEKETCIVCLDEHKPGQMMRTLPCMHVFHLKCIDKWLKNSLECPVCKTRIV
jgi:E3 ubiquitin-protein ligase SDIR1